MRFCWSNIRKILLLLFSILFLLVSYWYLEKKIPSRQDLLQKELKNINWNEVDEFPSVDSCNTIDNKEDCQRCFFNYLIQIIREKLNVDTLSLIYPHMDTIRLKVTVFPDSKIQFDSQDFGYQNQSKIDSILSNRLPDFPEIHPAIKRGIPVKTQFVLPIVLPVK